MQQVSQFDVEVIDYDREDGVATESVFDIPWAKEFNGVRQTFITKFLEDVRQRTELATALDVGCGVGWFSGFLSELHFHVIGVDGREENVAEAKRRYPEITFLLHDAEDPALPQIGSFDFVLCAGLLYHLENPFRAIRNLYAMTRKVLLIESMCAPGNEPTMDLLDEGPSENQGLNHVAFYPSESCFVKMLYRAGFPHVYRLKRLPQDDLYEASFWRKRLRTLLVASTIDLVVPDLLLVKEPTRTVPGRQDPWVTIPSRIRGLVNWNLWAAKLFNVRVIAAGWARRWRGRLDESEARGVDRFASTKPRQLLERQKQR